MNVDNHNNIVVVCMYLSKTGICTATATVIVVFLFLANYFSREWSNTIPFKREYLHSLAYAVFGSRHNAVLNEKEYVS